MNSVVIATELEELDPFLAAWDDLAIGARLPLCRPDWLLAWWRARNEEGISDAALRVVLVWDDEGLAGVAPLFVEDVRARVVTVRFLGHGALLGGQPLIRPSDADKTIGVVVGAIASLRPRPRIISFEAFDVRSEWPRALVQRWPERGAWLHIRPHKARATAIQLNGTFEEWIQSRRSDWRGEHRRRQRRFDEQGGTVRRAQTVEEVHRGVSALVRLHHARWTTASDALSPVIVRTLPEAGERLVACDGFRLWTAEIDGRIIGATLFAAAGGAVALLLTAFDREWGRFAPGLRSIVAGIEEGFQRSDNIVDLSFGEFPYKFQLANEVRWISWYEVFPRGHGYPLARAHALPRHTMETVNHLRVGLRARTRLAAARERVVKSLRTARQ